MKSEIVGSAYKVLVSFGVIQWLPVTHKKLDIGIHNSINRATIIYTVLVRISEAYYSWLMAMPIVN